MKKKSICFIIIFYLAIACLASLSSEASDLVNFSHLESLEFKFKDEKGKEYTSWAVYAEPVEEGKIDSSYRQVEASGEGYSCVDDVARIAILYLENYKKTRDKKFLEKAKKALEFLLYMEDGKGGFYNFIDKNGKINKTGKTSKSELDWWTARAFWALGKGIRILDSEDPELGERMNKSYDRTLKLLYKNREYPQIDNSLLIEYKLRSIKPGTLACESGAITSIFVLGLLEKFRISRDEKLGSLISDYCDTLVKMEETSSDRYPFKGLHYPTISNTDMVHFYGNRQVKALAEAGREMGVKRWIDSAEREANFAYPRLLTSWGVIFAFSPGPEIYPQIAYSAETIVSNLMAVYEATGKRKYADLSGIFSSWFMGNNPHNETMYIAYRGLCFDGIDRDGVNKNSGAESTVEALLAMTAVEGTPAEAYLDYSFDDGKSYMRNVLCVPAENLKTISGDMVWEKRTYTGGTSGKIIVMEKPATVETTLDFSQKNEYKIYLVYRKDGFEKSGEIVVTIAGRERKVYLPASKKDYQFKVALLGKIMVTKPESIKIVIQNRRNDQKILLDSIIVQPQIQQKFWPGKDHNVRMLVNTFPAAIPVPVDFGFLEEMTQDRFYFGDDLMLVYLPGESWMLFKYYSLPKQNQYKR